MVDDAPDNAVVVELPGTEVEGADVVEAAVGSTTSVVVGPTAVVVVAATEPATASALGDPSGVGASVTWDRTLAIPAAAITIASTVAPIHAAAIPIVCFMSPVSRRFAATALTHG